MGYEAFASEIAPIASASFSSIEENEQFLTQIGVEQNMRQQGSGSFKSHIALKTTPQAELVSDRFNLALTMDLAPPSGCIGFLFPRSVSGTFLASGVNLGNEKALFFAESSATQISVPDLVGSDTIVMTKQRFDELFHRLFPDCESTEGLTVLEGDETRILALRDTVARLVAQTADTVDQEEMSGVLSCAVSCLAELSPKQRSVTTPGIDSRWHIARTAREYIEENFCFPIESEQLCQATGSGVRTLQRSFQQCFGMTISSYIKTTRLDALDRALRAAHPSETTIATLCLMNGFTHYGRTSVQYHERFGLTPSQRLAEAR